MADLTYIQATTEVKIVGQDATGNNANYVGADANGNMTVKDYADGPVTPGAVASASSLIGGQFNTSLPTLTNTQQAAIQLDSSGRLLIGSIANALPAGTNSIGTVVQGNAGTNAQAWWTQIGDTSHGPVTVKAASTAAAAADLSLVTAFSPNSPLPAGTNTVGGVYLDDNPSKATYSASVVGLASAASATDIFTITGSNTKTIRITYLSVSGSTTSGSGLLDNVVLIKRSTANSGGTSAASTAVAHDSNNAAASATVLGYTANPTLGTAVGTVRSNRVAFQAAGVPSATVVWDWGTRPSEAIVLRGIAQVFAVNLSSTTVTGGVFNIDIEWTEE